MIFDPYLALHMQCGGQRFDKHRLFVADVFGYRMQVCHRRRQILRKSTITIANAKHLSHGAMFFCAAFAEVAIAATNIDFTNDSPA